MSAAEVVERQKEDLRAAGQFIVSRYPRLSVMKIYASLVDDRVAFGLV